MSAEFTYDRVLIVSDVRIVPCMRFICFLCDSWLSGAGDFAVAYLLYELAKPPRYIVTLGATQLTVKALRKRGIMEAPAQQDSIRNLVKEGRTLTKTRMEEKKVEMKDKFDDRRDKVKLNINDRRREFRRRIAGERARMRTRLGESGSQIRSRVEERREQLKQKIRNRKHMLKKKPPRDR